MERRAKRGERKIGKGKGEKRGEIEG